MKDNPLASLLQYIASTKELELEDSFIDRVFSKASDIITNEWTLAIEDPVYSMNAISLALQLLTDKQLYFNEQLINIHNARNLQARSIQNNKNPIIMIWNSPDFIKYYTIYEVGLYTVRVVFEKNYSRILSLEELIKKTYLSDSDYYSAVGFSVVSKYKRGQIVS